MAVQGPISSRGGLGLVDWIQGAAIGSDVPGARNRSQRIREHLQQIMQVSPPRRLSEGMPKEAARQRDSPTPPGRTRMLSGRPHHHRCRLPEPKRANR